MYQIRTTIEKGQVAFSQIFNSAWACNMIAISYIRNYPEVVKTEVINKTTAKVEKTYLKGA